MNLEGRIDIHLKRRAGQALDVCVQSSRPQVAQRLMAGRTPTEAADLAGMVFSLCGRAQRIAVEVACAAANATGVQATPAQAGKVLAEMAQEHAWRLLLDWPTRQGLATDPARLIGLRRHSDDPPALADTLNAVLTDVLLGEAAEAWLARFETPDPLAAFDTWAGARATPLAGLFADLAVDQGMGPKKIPDMGRSGLPLLPTLARLDHAAALDLARRAIDQPDFCRQPVWQGTPAETGAIARCFDQPPLSAWLAARGRGVGARMLARLLELARLPTRLRCPDGTVVRGWHLAATPGEETPDSRLGMAGVETSRGLLLHIVRLTGGKIDQYRILAPTEWNFHPEGPLAQALADLPMFDEMPEEMAARARQVALSLDPCVEYALTTESA
jgi:uptake hydrogenase large subunit